MSEDKVEGKYIYFWHDRGNDKPKTQLWEIFSKENHTWLGRIKWFARWRCYSWSSTYITGDHFAEGQRFVSDIVFEKECTREIADFCDKLTIEHRQNTIKKKVGT